ncbi:hypothetical protein [Methylocystis parvus]|uniref:hypothetical protein n=1 Tax=Methylocystis parvus TaxID=134 RepID=UPI003C791A8A
MRESLIRFLTPRSKREAIKLVALCTIVAIAATIVVDYPFVLALGAGLTMIFTSAVLIPLTLAPPMTWFVAEAARRKNEMKQELERLICIDPLSGALNRRGLAAFEQSVFREGGAKAALSAANRLCDSA